MNQIADAAWRCADPGVQYDTIINRWHTCPESGRINASNPCSEYMHVDDSACNLASLNLMKFRREDGSFDVEELRARGRHRLPRPGDRRRLLQLPDRGGSRERQQASASLALGYANLGALLMSDGLPY
jgi:ribonucleoside-diphosphate reductase alpha chain